MNPTAGAQRIVSAVVVLALVGVVDAGIGGEWDLFVLFLFGLVPFLLWALTGRKMFLQVGFVVFTFVVFGVAVSRVALGAHWPSDVIVSLLIGASLLLGAEQMLTSSWASSRCSTLALHRLHFHDT